MRHSILIIVTIIGSFMLCCISVALFWDGYYLPNKPCRPITYPNAKTTTESFSILTQDSLESVLEFYSQNLRTKSIYIADTGDWTMEELSTNKYLFSCYAPDMNRITTESGCVYVSFEKTYTRIEGNLTRSEGSNVPCMR